jgi:hypothetical protein
MAQNMDLIRAGLAATAAAEALQAKTRVTAATKRLNLADHAGILEALRFTVLGTWRENGLLHAVLGAISAQQATYADPHDGIARELAKGLTVLHDAATRARSQAREADDDLAFGRVRVDVRQLSLDGSPAGRPSPRRGALVVASVAEASAQLSEFRLGLPAADQAVDDLVTAFGSSADITAALKIVCNQEASLLDAAYEAAGMRRSAAAASDVLRGASRAMSRANATLAEACEKAKQLATLERRLRTAI